MINYRIFFLLLFLLVSGQILAQTKPNVKTRVKKYFTDAQYESDESPMIYNFRGLQFAVKDSSFYMNFRFRMQNRLGLTTFSAQDIGIKEVEARVRRLRMRIDGYVFNPKFAYTIQLSFARSDQDFDNTGIANIVRDAMIYYMPHKNIQIAFGQNKLPGNRQRVVSSGQLEFADRSIVNNTFTIDRDFGIKVYYTLPIKKAQIKFKGAVSTGEGRSINTTNSGLAYTGRIEILPLGKFTDNGDYSEADLEREKKPKLSIGLGYNYNDRAQRTGLQLGKTLYSSKNVGTIIADLLFKYQGFSYAAEYMNRYTPNPISISDEGDIRYVYKGQGTNHQLSYVMPRWYSINFRYSLILPNESIKAYENRTEILELGVNKFLNKHRVKIQCSFYYSVKNGFYTTKNPLNNWGSLFQVEFGI